MSISKVIIADTDLNYIAPLQLKFVQNFMDEIELEIITSVNYYEEYFSKPQKAAVLVVSEDLYTAALLKHNIDNIFVMMEKYDDSETGETGVTRLFKYTSIKEIFNEIVGKSASALNAIQKVKQGTQIIVVTSANGGAGKTTVAMGLSACLVKNYKKVLYINACRLQTFQYMLENKTPIFSAETYAKLMDSDSEIYQDVKHVIRQETFSYLPPFRASLLSLGLNYSVYENIIMGAKQSQEYDYIVIDTESTFDVAKAKLLDMADKVVLVSEQSLCSIMAMNALVSNINGITSEKYIFVCNKFAKEKYNALNSPDVEAKFNNNEYIEYFEVNGSLRVEPLSKNKDIQKVSFLTI